MIFKILVLNLIHLNIFLTHFYDYEQPSLIYFNLVIANKREDIALNEEICFSVNYYSDNTNEPTNVVFWLATKMLMEKSLDLSICEFDISKVSFFNVKGFKKKSIYQRNK